MSEPKTIWALRILALALAILAWTFISLDRERQSERPLTATVQYNLPENLVVLDPVETVNIRLSGSENSFNNLGQVAFTYLLDNGEAGVALADVTFVTSGLPFSDGFECD